MVSTGGAVGMTIEERMGGVRASPDVVGVETGSVNFGGDEVFATSDDETLAVIEAARRAGATLEVEAFDVGHVLRAVRLVEEGILDAPLRVNFVFGVAGGIDPTNAGLHAMLRPLRPESQWSVTAVGRHQWRMLALGVLSGAAGIRVGFEDNLYLARGVKAETNAALVRRAAELVTSLGRRVATPEEARQLLCSGAPHPEHEDKAKT
jgi:3-keto-5-aminohexanoate cleavage enzyme